LRSAAFRVLIQDISGRPKDPPIRL